MSRTKATSVLAVENIIGYTFTNDDLCWEALQGKNAGGYPEGNTRLALLGNSVIRYRLLLAWFSSGRSIDHGHSISTSVQKLRLVEIGRKLGLDRFVNPNPSQKGVVEDSLVVAAVEGLVGAVEVDGGSEDLDEVMRAMGLL